VQGDALSAHNALFVDGQRVEVGCWAHARRKFIDAEMTDAALAKEAISLIGELYEVERRAKLAQMNATELGQLRATESKPILARIRDWLDLTTTKVLPQSPIAKGIGYCRNQWQALCRFADDGRIRDIDNNSAERALRAVALGRKSWLFIGAEERAHHNLVLMTLIATCRLLGINPREYISDVLVRLSLETDVSRLTPAGWKADQAAAKRVAVARQAVAAVVASFQPQTA
jgi:hypothetical protein